MTPPPLATLSTFVVWRGRTSLCSADYLASDCSLRSRIVSLAFSARGEPFTSNGIEDRSGFDLLGFVGAFFGFAVWTLLSVAGYVVSLALKYGLSPPNWMPTIGKVSWLKAVTESPRGKGRLIFSGARRCLAYAARLARHTCQLHAGALSH